MHDSERERASVDGDASLTALIQRGLVEMVMTDDGPMYAIARAYAGPNAATPEQRRSPDRE